MQVYVLMSQSRRVAESQGYRYVDHELARFNFDLQDVFSVADHPGLSGHGVSMVFPLAQLSLTSNLTGTFWLRPKHFCQVFPLDQHGKPVFLGNITSRSAHASNPRWATSHRSDLNGQTPVLRDDGQFGHMTIYLNTVRQATTCDRGRFRIDEVAFSMPDSDWAIMPCVVTVPAPPCPN